jgi:hypothetical protein
MHGLELATGRTSMNLRQLSTHGLLMLYQSVKLALEEDDKAPDAPPFEVRSNPDWRSWSDQIGAELAQRGTEFKPIEWQNEVGRHPEADSGLNSGSVATPEISPSDKPGDKPDG